MNAEPRAMENNKPIVYKIINWLFGIAVLTVGLINTLWGNDPGFGVFLVVLSFIYFPPFNGLIIKKTGIKIPAIAKIALAIFIIWSSLGVGELFDKIYLMMQDFQ
jgi:hypothetical protein